VPRRFFNDVKVVRASFRLLLALRILAIQNSREFKKRREKSMYESMQISAADVYPLSLQEHSVSEQSFVTRNLDFYVEITILRDLKFCWIQMKVILKIILLDYQNNVGVFKIMKNAVKGLDVLCNYFDRSIKLFFWSVSAKNFRSFLCK